jgi:hypothetical protein
VGTEATESKSAADRLSQRIQALYDSLPADEQPLLRALLTQASDDDVAGFVQSGDRVRIRVAEAPYPDSPRSDVVEVLL